MHLASPTGPAHAAVSSDIMRKNSSATCSSSVPRHGSFSNLSKTPAGHTAYINPASL
jgi:hypothetical protein